jgi:hypothetical protein
MYAQNNSLAQKFDVNYDANTGYYSIINVNGNKSIDIKGNGSGNGTHLQAWEYNGGKNQKWTIEPSGSGYKIIAGNCGKVLDVQGGSQANGASVQIYQSNGTATQQWKFNPANSVENGTYYINTSLGTNLDIHNRSTNVNANVQAYQIKNGEIAQKFYISRISGSGKYARYTISSIIKSSNNLLVGVNGSNVALTSYTANDATTWEMVPDGNGRYYIKNPASGKFMDVAGASKAWGANIQTYIPNWSIAQRFQLSRTQ